MSSRSDPSRAEGELPAGDHDTCCNLNCKWSRPPPKGEVKTMQRCSQCKSSTYCSTECQRLDWKRHKITCASFASTGIDAYALRERMGRFLQLFFSFPEIVFDFIDDVRRLPRGSPHLSIHFDRAADLERFIRHLERQKVWEHDQLVARTLFRPEGERQRWLEALARRIPAPDEAARKNTPPDERRVGEFDEQGEYRLWNSHAEAVAFRRELKDALQWQLDPGAVARVMAGPNPPDLGPSGVVLGISCIINPKDRSQTNILNPLFVDGPRLPPLTAEEEAKRPTMMDVPGPGDEGCPMQ